MFWGFLGMFLGFLRCKVFLSLGGRCLDHVKSRGCLDSDDWLEGWFVCDNLDVEGLFGRFGRTCC